MTAARSLGAARAASTERGRALRQALLAANRLVWTLALASWAVVLLAGSYLDKVHLTASGAASLAVTSAFGIAYLVTRGRPWHRVLGIVANTLLVVEFALHIADGWQSSPGAGSVVLIAVVLVVLIGPLWVLVRDGVAYEE